MFGHDETGMLGIHRQVGTAVLIHKTFSSRHDAEVSLTVIITRTASSLLLLVALALTRLVARPLLKVACNQKHQNRTCEKKGGYEVKSSWAGSPSDGGPTE